MSDRFLSRPERPLSRRARQQVRCRQNTLRMESLEDRAMMAAYVWEGDVDSNWETPGNWNLNSGVPDDATDTVVINTGTPFSPQLSTNRLINSLSGTGDLDLQGFRLTSNTTASTTFSGAISGAGGGITKQGTGTLTLSGTTPNTYTGLTIVNTGVLLLNKTAGVDAIGSGGFSIITTAASAGVVRLGASNQIADNAPIRVDAAISGGNANFDLANLSEAIGSVYMRTVTSSGTPPGSNITIGTGQLTLNGDVTFEYDRNSGGNDDDWLAITGTGAGTVNLNGGTRTFTVNLGPAVTPANEPGSDARISAAVTNGSIIKEGTRRLDLNAGAVTAIADIDVNAGELVLRNAANSITSIDVNGGRLIFTTVGALGGAVINVANGASLTGSLGTAATMNNVVNVAAGGNISARGQTLTLTTNTNLSAPIAAGLLKFNEDTSTTVTLVVPHAIAMVGDLTVQVGNNETASATGQAQLTGVISGSGSLTKIGHNSLRLSATNTYTGSTSILNGTIFVTGNIAPSTNGNLGNSATPIVIGDTSGTAGPGLFTDGTLTISRDIHIRAGSSGAKRIGIAGTASATVSGTITLDDHVTFQVNNTPTLTVSSLLQDSGGSRNVTKTETGNLLLTNTANSYSGDTTVLEGAILLGGDVPGGVNSVLGSSAAPILLGATSGSDNAAILTNGAFTLSRPIIVRSGSTGEKAIGGNSASTSTINSVITLNDHLTLRQNSTGTVHVDSLLADSGGPRNISKDGTGIVFIDTPNSYTGTTLIENGSLVIGDPLAVGPGSTITVLASGSLGLSNLTAPLTEPIFIRGAGAGGAGTINNVAGNNTVNSDITFNHHSTIGSTSGKLTLGGNFLDFEGFEIVTFNGAGDIDVLTSFGSNGVFTYDYQLRILDSPGFDPQTEAGIAALLAASATYTTFDSKHVHFNDDAAFETEAGFDVDAGSDDHSMFVITEWTPDAFGTWDFRYNNVDDQAAIWIDKDRDGIFESGAGALNGNELIHNRGTSNQGTGTGSWLLDGSNHVAGQTYRVVYAMRDTGGDGYFRDLEVRGPAGSSANSGTAFTNFDPSLPQLANLFSWPMAASDGVVKTGTGTVTLFGNNTYGGTTSINQGTLVAANANALGLTSGNTVVASGATLGVSSVGSLAEPISAIGGGAGGAGAVNNVAGNNTVPNLTLTGATTLGNSAAGTTLTIPGDFDLFTSPITTTGVGDILLSGVLSSTDATLTALTVDQALGAKTTLSGANTFDGAAIVEGGTLVAASSSALGATGAGNETVVQAGAVLAFDNTIADLADNSTLDNSANLTSAESIELDSVLTANEATLHNIRGNNTITGNVTVVEQFPPTVDFSGSLGNGLELWLDASNIASIVDGNGGALSNGDPIAGWNDTLIGGNTVSNNAVQATTAKRPVYVASSLNGLPAIRFTAVDNSDANSDDLQAAGLTLGNNVTIFAVIQHALQTDNSGSSVRPFFVGAGDGFAQPGDGYTLALQRPGFNNGFRVESPGYNDKVSSVPVANDLQFHMYSFSRNGTTTNGVNVYFDGAATPILTGTSSGNATDTTYSIGGENNGNANRQYTGDIPEIIAFNRTLSTAERLQVEAYLRAKYFNVGVPATPGQGTISSQADTLTINGNVSFPKLTLNGGGNVVFNGQLQNGPTTTGELVKEGAGVASLDGIGTYTGTTTINAGTLLVNGIIADGAAATDVTVNAFGTLGGEGIIDGVTSLNANANLAPGMNGPGTLDFTQGLTFNPGSTFFVDINGDTAGDGFGFHDQVATSTAPDLSGVNLIATRIDTLANPYPFSAVASPTSVDRDDVYVILENASGSPVVGNFLGLAEGAEVAIANFPPTLIATITYVHNGVSGGSNDVAIIVDRRNNAPTITSNGNVVTSEPTATNSGTFNDLQFDDTVTISVVSGPGSVTQSPGTDRPGTWTWNATGLDGPSGFSVTIRASDGVLFSDTTFLVNVNNLPPTVNAGGNATVNEGATFTRAGNVTDPGPDTIVSGTVNYGDGSGTLPLTITGGNFNLSHVFVDNGTYTVTVTATDDDSGTGTTTFQVQVNNVAPVPNAGADTSVAEGTTFTRSGTISDAGTSDTFPSGTVNYGDGTGNQPLTIIGNTFQLNHVYADDGNYTVTVTVNDDDGTPGTDTMQVLVTNAVPTVLPVANQTNTEGFVFNIPTINFNDRGTLDTHTATINWGDTTSSAGTVTQTPSGPPGSTAGTNGTVTGSHVYADNGTFTVTVTITDDNGGSVQTTFQVVVSNANPVVTPRGNITVNEGSIVDLGSSSFNDRGTLDTHTATVNWGIGGTVPATVTETPTGPPGNVAGTTGTLAATHQYADNVGSPFTVNLTVTDDNGGVGTASFTVTVNNVAPVMDPLSGPTGGVPGQVLEYTFSATDVAPADEAAGFQFRIDWDGNGSIDQTIPASPGQTSVTVTHAYATAGDFTIRVQAVDKDGGVSLAETQDVTIDQFVIDENGNLIGAGTNSSDRVTIQAGRGGIQVRMNNVFYGPFDVVERVIFFAQGGNDTVQMMANAGLILEVYGGAGNDTLTGAGLDDTLYGEAGDDNLKGLGGNDYIDGGIGNDKIDASTGDDWIYGGDGNDSLTAGLGNDTANGGLGRDSIFGNDGDDILRGGGDGDTLAGGRGSDILFGNDGNDTLKGDDGNDILVGGRHVDYMQGGLMDDLLIGGEAGGDAAVSLGTRDDDFSSDDALTLVLADWNTDALLGLDSFLALGDVTYNDGNDRIWGNAGIDLFYSSKVEAQDEANNEEVIF